MTTAIATTNNAALSRITPQQADELFNKIVLENDLSDFSPSQRVLVYKIVCERAGLDPYTKPFQLLKLNGKLSLYADKNCSAQLTQLHSLTVSIIERGKDDLNIYTVLARVVKPKGFPVEDIGCVPIDGLRGEALANAYMKAATKAKRRSILSACGIGFLDRTEVESIADAEIIEIEIPEDHTDEIEEAIATWTAKIEESDNAATLTEVAKTILTLSDAVKKGTRPALAKRAEQLHLRWGKDGYITVKREEVAA